MGGGILGVAVGGDVGVAAAEGLELLERLGGGAGAAIRAATVRVIMGAVPIGAIREAVTVAEERGGDFRGGGEIIGSDLETIGAQVVPAAQLREADEADAVAL